MSPEYLLIIAGVLIVVGLGAVMIGVSLSCPNCGRFWGLRSTGQRTNTEEEYKCRHCGRTQWKHESHRSGF